MSCTAYTNGQNAQIQLTAGQLAQGFCHQTWQGTFEAFVAAIVASLPNGFSTFTIGSDVPAANDQDKLWFKVNADCSPVGWMIYYGGAWVRAVPHPLLPGTILDYYDSTWASKTHAQVADEVKLLDGGTALSPFWRLCDGTNGTPDLRGRVRVGAGAGGSLTDRAQGNTGGEESHVLQVSEIPPLSPDVPMGTAGGSGAAMKAASDGSKLSTVSVGGGGAHQNMPPYYCLYQIMRTTRMI